MGADVLQYGALGVLTLVLVAIAAYIRERAKDEQERTLAVETQRQRDAAFIQDLVKTGLASNDESRRAFQQLAEQSAEALQRVTTALDELCTRTTEEHGEMTRELHGLRSQLSRKGAIGGSGA